jgi:hypothetical protein
MEDKKPAVLSDEHFLLVLLFALAALAVVALVRH